MSILKVVKLVVPTSIRRCIRAKRQRLSYWPLVGWVRLGSLRRLQPISRAFGLDRGHPIDRYYIENFLKKHSADIRGRVLEIGDSRYTQKFGGQRVVQSNVLHVVPGNPQATLVGDLATGQGIPKDAFDCVILTQTLPHIYDVRGAVGNAYGALKTGGVLLSTFPGIAFGSF